MKDSEILGIHFRNKRVFYYFDNGQHTPGQAGIDRLRTVLMARGLIVFTDEGTTQYEIITLAKARADELTVEVIYSSPFIRKLNEASRATRGGSGTLWD